MTNRGKIRLVSLALLASALIYACRSTRAGKSETFGLASVCLESLRQLVIDQPDFRAEESERFSEKHLIAELRGFSTSYRVAKKGLTYRRDRDMVIGYGRSDEPSLLLYPRSREYVESPHLGVWFENAASPSLLAAEQGANLLFESLGDEQLDGRRCLKIQVSMPKEAAKSSMPTKVVYYLASDLRNLVIRTDLIDMLGTTIYTLKNISFDVPDELFRVPPGYKKSVADPTAEYRLRDHFELADLERLEPKSFRKSLLERLPPGTPEEQVYRYLEERLVGKDRLSSFYRAGQDGQIVCRIEYDPALPGPVKKHFAVVFQLDTERKLRDIRLDSWVSAP